VTPRPHGQIRRSQAISTFGPGSLIDLPTESAIIGGLEGWPKVSELTEILEPRLSAKLEALTSVSAPRLYAPPADSSTAWEAGPGVTAWRFPEWFVVQERETDADAGRGPQQPSRSRRLVHRKLLDGRHFDKLRVVPTRFVRACPKGHVSDLDWRGFVHHGATECKSRQLWLDERGTGGDLGDLWVRCECGASRQMSDATEIEAIPLGHCTGERPWLGREAREDCGVPARLLIRTATNAYFPQVVSVLALPDRRTAIDAAVTQVWQLVHIVKDALTLSVVRQFPQVAAALASFSDADVLAAIEQRSGGQGKELPVKQVELDAILAAPDGYGEDVPPDRDFFARRLPEAIWRKSSVTDPIEAVIQLHRLREVSAVAGFTRFEAMTPDIHGEYDSDVKPAPIALEPKWFPAVENRGEGIFVQLRGAAVREWLERPGVKRRIDALIEGFRLWQHARGSKKAREFVGGPYVLLHTLSHLVLQSLAMSCGYPASSIKERIYVGERQFGFLLYTGTPDADGTLGGLVDQARHIDRHVSDALRFAGLCSNDPICAQHEAGKSMEGRWLHGAACHGCSFIAETSCEMRNDYLDRALVVPVLGIEDAAFFGGLGG
jgi:hypothetical protein